ncbi:MAG: GNAT family N-acetyltransferase [Actinomycetota bacterium]|nr:GNAT family N-acetyltransferase [Actinomycetota bacterium]
MVGPAEAVTERLVCARPAASSVNDYREIFAEPEINRWLRPEPLKPFTPAEADRLYRHDRGHWRRYGFGPWAVRERESDRFVGRGGLAWTTVEGERMVELPWAIRTEFHGRGYATEQAGAALLAARDRGFNRVVSLTLPHNLASRRVMEKIGLVCAGNVNHAGLPHVLYEMRF